MTDASGDDQIHTIGDLVHEDYIVVHANDSAAVPAAAFAPGGGPGATVGTAAAGAVVGGLSVGRVAAVPLAPGSQFAQVSTTDEPT